jgi:hypothetical protein
LQIVSVLTEQPARPDPANAHLFRPRVQLFRDLLLIADSPTQSGGEGGRAGPLHPRWVFLDQESLFDW